MAALADGWQQVKTRDWWIQALADWLLYLLVAITLGLIARTRVAWWSMLVPVAVAGATMVFARKRSGSDTEQRLWLGVALLLVGVATCVLCLNRDWSDLYGFAGAATAAYGYGSVISHARSRCKRDAGHWCFWVGLGVVVTALLALALAGAALVTWSAAGRRFIPWVLTIASLALVVAQSVLAEGALRRLETSARARRIVPVAGVAILVAAFISLVIYGLPPVYSLIAIAVAFAIAGTVVSDSNADAFLLIVIIAIVWVTSPGTEPAPEVANGGGPSLLAVGDSFMSGEGAPVFYQGTNQPDVNECRRAPTAYAVRMVESGAPGLAGSLTFVACSGADTIHIDQTPQYNEGTQIARIGELGATPSNTQLVFVSIGGNDALFGQIGKSCVLPGDCSTIGDTWLSNLAIAGTDIEQALKAVRDEFDAQVPIVAVPYPNPISEEGCSWSALTEREHRFLHQFTNELDRVVAIAAQRAGVHYLASMNTAFSSMEPNLRICDGDAGDIGVNFVALTSVNGVRQQRLNPSNWIHNSLHPNPDGHERMADIALEWFGTEGKSLVGNPEPVREDVYEVTDLARLMGSDFKHCGNAASSFRYCDKRNDPDSWVVAQSVAVARIVLPLLLAIITAAWLVWLGIVRWWRDRNDERGLRS